MVSRSDRQSGSDRRRAEMGAGRMRRSRGVTLPEILVSMVIMALVAGVVSALYFASLHVWRRCSSQSQADPPAHMAIARVTKELKNAYQVTSMGNDAITFLLPRTDPSGTNLLPLQAAKEISYYLSDASGVQGQPGTILWRKEVDVVNNWTRTQRIAENVEQLAFDYDTTSENRVLAIYALSITVIGQEGHQEYHSAFGSHIAFRNP